MLPTRSTEILHKTRRYLEENLIPFWAGRVVEPEFGGFQTNYDRHGQRTAVTEKALLSQARCIFSISHVLRQGFSWPGGEVALAQGLDFLFTHFKDPEYGGYYWMVAGDGAVLDDSKVIYGHAFVIYALSEYALLSGDARCRAEVAALFALLQEKALDNQNGGYFEHFDRRFAPIAVRPDGRLHKSLDVHMHLMEAFTPLYELTAAPAYREALEQVIDLIFSKMVDPETGTGIAMFTPQWQPINNVQLTTLWGRDRFDPEGKAPEITSYGHNIELAWLYLHAQDILGSPRKQHLEQVLPIFEHTTTHGVDWRHGGIFVEGHRAGAPTETTKEFWQQAEAMVGFLDAFLLTGEEKYFEAFANVHRFVFEKMINWEQGEWFALLHREGEPIWDYMGTSWKTCYHTLRSMCQVVRRLELIPV